ncbi:MAG TPA: GNAT family N-acetyltransferase [Vicinamibacterales bacterium]
MNTLSIARSLTASSAAPFPSSQETVLCVREAVAADAPAIHALITEHIAEGHLLPRSLEEIRAHAHRFLVVTQDGRLAGCGELAPLSAEVSEIRSLVVSPDVRSLGVGTAIIERLVQRAANRGFDKLCAFTHEPSYFVHRGFSIVPHVWLPEKIVTDCHSCPHFRRCGQYAVVRALGQRRALHG